MARLAPLIRTSVRRSLKVDFTGYLAIEQTEVEADIEFVNFFQQIFGLPSALSLYQI
jgi:hypothetical protein